MTPDEREELRRALDRFWYRRVLPALVVSFLVVNLLVALLTAWARGDL